MPGNCGFAGLRQLYLRFRKEENDVKEIEGDESMSKENDKGNYYITTAIAYTSGKPHIGNTYEIVLADAIARFKRAEGYRVRFQTGTDEHGRRDPQYLGYDEHFL